MAINITLNVSLGAPQAAGAVTTAMQYAWQWINNAIHGRGGVR